MTAATLLLSPLAPAASPPATPPAPAAPAADPAGLAAVRQQAIAAARETQEREQAIIALQHKIDLLDRDAAGRRRDIDDSRPEQARFLGMLAFLARAFDSPYTGADLSPLDRARADLLVKAAVPGIRAEAQALAGEIARIASLKSEAAADRADLEKMHAALARDGDRLAQIATRRADLLRQLLPPVPPDLQPPKIAEAAKTLDDLIRLADAAAERRDQQLVARARAAHAAHVDPATPASFDPSCPAATTAAAGTPAGAAAGATGLRAFDPPQSALTPPVSGPITTAFGAGGDTGNTPSNGLSFAPLPAAEVVAAFDGRVVYVGPFRDLGLVLIIRHGRLYHSVLAGLGRVDVAVDDWVLAGEPVGTMPVAVASSGGGFGPPLYFEMRREGRPVDPQPWLASDDEGHGEQAIDQNNGDQKVRQ